MLDFVIKTVSFLLAVLIAVIGFFKGISNHFSRPDPLPTETSVCETTTEIELTTSPEPTTEIEPATEAETTTEVTTATEPATAPATTKQGVTVTVPEKTTVEDLTHVREALSRGKKSFGGTGVDVFSGADADAEFVYACGYTTSKDGDMAGNTGTAYASNGSFVAKFDMSMNKKWNCILSEKGKTVTVSDVAVLKDKTIVAVGYSNASAYASDPAYAGTNEAVIWKISPDGVLLSKVSFGGSGSDKFNCVCAVGDGFAAGGAALSNDGSFNNYSSDGKPCAFVMWFDGENNVINKYCVDGTNGGSVEGIASDKNGNVFISIVTNSTDGGFAAFEELKGVYPDTVIMKFNSDRDCEWNYVIASSGRDEFGAIAADEEGGCVVGGSYALGKNASPDGTLRGIYNYGGADAVVFRINQDGTKRWHKCIAGTENETVTDVIKVNSGFVAVGETNSADCEFSGTGSKGKNDGFAALLTPGGKTAQILTQGGARNDGATCAAVSYNNLFILGKTVSSDGYFSTFNAGLSDALVDALGDMYSGYISKFTLKIY